MIFLTVGTNHARFDRLLAALDEPAVPAPTTAPLDLSSDLRSYVEAVTAR